MPKHGPLARPAHAGASVQPPDRWLVLTVTPGPDSGPASPQGSGSVGPPDALSETIPEVLVDMGGQGVVETSNSYTTYLPPPQDPDVFTQAARDRLVRVTGGLVEVVWSWLPQEDWDALWRRGLGPRRITPRLTVAPSWDIPAVESDELLIVMDPGMAFGTAEHGTTRGCLRLLDSLVRSGDRIADVGSGSGILSIAAALMGAKTVLALESDPVSCEVARVNLAENGVADRVSVANREVRGPQPIYGGPFNGIVANIQSSVLFPLLPGFRSSLVAGAWLLLSGILMEERGSALAETSAQGFALENEDRDGEWWSAAFRSVEASR